MYEPEEKKDSRVREFFERLSNRIRNPVRAFSFGGFRENKLPLVLAILAVLFIGGLGYTGYVTYTSKVAQTESQLLIQERQINALEEDLNAYKTNLAVCETNLENTQEILTKTETDLKETEDKLATCTTDYTNLINSTAATQTAYVELQNKHTQLQTYYKSLECSYAESEGCNYYTVPNSEVLCCVKIEEKFYCGPQGVPTNSTDVKQVSEYC